MKNKNFKVGNIIEHSVSRHKDNFTVDSDGERRFKNREVYHEKETLLIVGYEDSSFIVFPMQSDFKHIGTHRKYFDYGSFERCFKMFAKYVNQACTPVSA
jgi:hypothetical protein